MAVWDIKERNNLVRGNAHQGLGRIGLFMGNLNPGLGDDVSQINMTSNSNGTDFGNLTVAIKKSAGAGGFTRVLNAGGQTPSGVNTIDFANPVSAGNFADFGNLTATGELTNIGHSNNVRAVFSSGNATPNVNLCTVIMASQGNASDFGDATRSQLWSTGGGNNTRFITAGQYAAPGGSNVIDIKAMANDGNSTDFGDLAAAGWGHATGSSPTRLVFGGGNNAPGIIDVLQFITMSTKGNATDFGNLVKAIGDTSAVSNSVRAIFGGADSGGAEASLDVITIAAKGNATDFGDLNVTKAQCAGADNGGGGLPQEDNFPQRKELFALNRSGQTLGLFGGGNDGPAYLSSCEAVQVETLGRSSSFGDLTQTVNNSFSMSGNRTRGVRHSGYIGGSSPYTTNTMDYTEFASRGNFADFGNATAAGYGASRGPSTNDTRSFSMGFYNASGNLTTVDYWAPATLGNAADFGDLSVGSLKAAGMANTTRVIRYGSYGVNTIDYHAIASLGDFSDFGDAVAALGAGEAVSSPVRGVRCGAQSASNTMEYITMASTGNGTDFGDLTVGRSDMGAASSHTRGVIFAGVGSPAIVNTIDYITIASAGNATDFGDASFARGSLAGMGNGHGGLA